MVKIIDTDPGRVDRRIRQLELIVNAMRSERRAAATTVTGGDLIISGGGALIVDGGDFLLLDTDKSTVFRLGPQEHGDRGVTLSREDGTDALTVSEFFAGGVQTIRIYDSTGENEIVGQEALGTGLARPYLSLPMQPVLATVGAVQAGPYGFEVDAATATWTPVFRTQFARQNQFVTVRLQIAASDTTTAAEVRLVDPDDATHLGQFLAGPFTATRAAGSTDYVEVSLPAIAMPGLFMESVALAVEVRRTAGAGTLHCSVVESRGGL